MSEQLKRYWSLLGGLAALAILSAIVFVNVRLKDLALRPVGTPVGDLVQVGQAWGMTALLIAAFLALIGVAINNRPAGILIDNRHRVSLSKFQAVLWTVLILSALITSAAARATVADALPTTAGGVVGFGIPPELLAAMGIALTTLVATPALLSRRTGNAADPQALAAAAARTGRDPAMITAAGRVVGWRSAACAQWMDMFRGDDDSNAGAPDLSKVQQFLITLTLVGVYAGTIWAGFTDADARFLQGPGIWLPPLDSNFVWLLGISHAGYLAYKAAPHGGQGAGGGAAPAAAAAATPPRVRAAAKAPTAPPPAAPGSGAVG